MTDKDVQTLADELMKAKTNGGDATRPSAQYPDFGMNEAYTVGQELTRRLVAQGYKPNGRKIGFTNPVLWPRLNLDGPIWAYTYDQTVEFFPDNQAKLSLTAMAAPKIEPEIVFKLSAPLSVTSSQDVEQILEAIEWMALGFEIVDCNYPNWHFRAADMVADFGFHAALLIGQTQPLNELNRKALAQQLAGLQVKLLKNGEEVAQGAGQNVMGSPALALGGLVALLDKQDARLQLAAGEIVTTGTMTDAAFIGRGETWIAQLHGLDLPPFTISFS